MDDVKNQYYSYLLRLWPVKINDHTVWRVSLESSMTGEKWGFADIGALCEFLQQRDWQKQDSEKTLGGDATND
jgi:hypothetical protein